MSFKLPASWVNKFLINVRSLRAFYQHFSVPIPISSELPKVVPIPFEFRLNLYSESDIGADTSSHGDRNRNSELAERPKNVGIGTNRNRNSDSGRSLLATRALCSNYIK